MTPTETPQYTAGSIAAYEKVYGPDFVSPGGVESARRFLAALQLPPGGRALDVGSGLGGCAFLLAREHGMTVDGVDYAPEMVAMARARLAAHGLGDRVSFARGDVRELDRPARYDLIHAREVFLHLADKAALFRVLAAASKPGGTLFFTDYLRGPDPYSPGFQAYITRYGYTLHTLEEYPEILRAAGFVVEEAVDQTADFLAIHRRELAAMPGAGIPRPYLDELVEGWEAKIARAEAGEQRWGRFWARRA